jgi:methionyl-tRNA formyltransferase
MKIMFIGCVESSFHLLDELMKNKKNICGVVTKSSSTINSDFVDLSEICIRNNIPFFHFTSNIDPLFIDFVTMHSPDMIYCFGWSHLLKDDILSIPKIGSIGFHPAALPQNRGRHPIIWAIALGLENTASTFFSLTSKADEGDIVSQKKVPISKTDTARDLYDKIIAIAKTQIIDLTNAYESGPVEYISQKHQITNSWRKRSKKDGQIDFRMSAQGINNLVRALTKPYVGAHFVFQDREYKVWNVEVVEDIDNQYENIEFGKVIKVYTSGLFLIKTGDKLIKVTDCDEINLQEGDYL